jgi:ubiquinone/menaquinone biosynthesis C-methylase UbiE
VDAARRRFDRWAGTYEKDRLSRWTAGLQKGAVEALGLRPSDRVLDLGCGTGQAVRGAAGITERAVGVDLSPAMIERARAWPGLPSNAEFRVGEAGEIPAKDSEFTAALCTNSFHHYPEPRAAIAELSRVLEPGGRLVIGDGCADRWAARFADRLLRAFEPGHVRLYRSVELGGMLYRSSFREVEIRRLWDGGYMFVRGRKT